MAKQSEEEVDSVLPDRQEVGRVHLPYGATEPVLVVAPFTSVVLARRAWLPVHCEVCDPGTEGESGG